MPTEQENFMAQALALAAEAAAAGEVPVGCVIVRDGEIVGRGRNRREEKQATASHAEMEAIAQANEHLGTWRLDDCELYVTLEPCPMCAGAILNARIRRVFGIKVLVNTGESQQVISTEVNAYFFQPYLINNSSR